MTCRARALGAGTAARCWTGAGELAGKTVGSKAKPDEPHH